MARVNVDMSSNALLDEYFGVIEDADVIEESIEVELNPDPDSKKWQPKKWHPKYEQVVMMDLAGLKGYEIAEKMGLTPQHVYNILGCDEAIAIQKALLGKIRKEGSNIVDDLQEIQKLTVRRLKSCLKDDDTFKESRLGFITKGIDVMKGLGEHLKSTPGEVNNTNNFILPPSVADKFLAGLEKSDEARKLLVQGREVGVVENNG